MSKTDLEAWLEEEVILPTEKLKEICWLAIKGLRGAKEKE